MDDFRTNKHTKLRRQLYHNVFNIHPKDFKHMPHMPLFSNPHHFAKAIEHGFSNKHLPMVQQHINSHNINAPNTDAPMPEGGGLMENIESGVGKAISGANKGLDYIEQSKLLNMGKNLYTGAYPQMKALEAGIRAAGQAQKEFSAQQGGGLFEDIGHGVKKGIHQANKALNYIDKNPVLKATKEVYGALNPNIKLAEAGVRAAGKATGGGSSTGGAFYTGGSMPTGGIIADQALLKKSTQHLLKGGGLQTGGCNMGSGLQTGGSCGPRDNKMFKEKKGLGGSFRTGGSFGSGGSMQTGGGSSTGGAFRTGGALHTGGALPPGIKGSENLMPMPENVAEFHAAYNQSAGPKSGYMSTMQTQATANFPDPVNTYDKLYKKMTKPKPSYNNKEDKMMSNNEMYGMANEAQEQYNKTKIAVAKVRKGNNSALGVDTLDFNEWGQREEQKRWRKDQDMWGGWGNVVYDEHGKKGSDRFQDMADHTDNKHHMYNTAGGVWMHHSKMSNMAKNVVDDQPELLVPHDSLTYSMNPYTYIEAGIDEENLTGRHLRSYADIAPHADQDKAKESKNMKAQGSFSGGGSFHSGGNLFAKRTVINNARMGTQRLSPIPENQRLPKGQVMQNQMGGGSSTGGAFYTGGSMPTGGAMNTGGQAQDQPDVIPQGGMPHPQHHTKYEPNMPGQRDAMQITNPRDMGRLEHMPQERPTPGLKLGRDGRGRAPDNGPRGKANHYKPYRKALIDELSYQARGFEPSEVWGKLIPETEGLRDKEKNYAHIPQVPFHLGTKAANHLDEIADRIKAFRLPHEKDGTFIQRHLL